MSTGRRGALVCLLLALSALRPFPAAAEDFVIFGPVRYERSTGQPGLSTATFNVPEPLAPVSLRLVNGDAAGARRVSSAEIWVNGAMVLGPRDFNQRVSHLIVPLHGLDLRNSLWIRIASGPAAFLTLEVTTPFAPATPPVTPVLDTYTAATAADAVTLTGTSRRAVTLEVSAPTGVLSVPVASGAFRAEVPLRADSLNQIFLTGISAAGVRSAPAAAAITQDGQAPHLFVDYPSEGSLLANDAVDVAGRVGDMLSGRLGLAVSVNGVPASVGLGVGSDGTFVARGVPLRSGEPTVLTATATDALGNEASRRVTVARIELPPGAPGLRILAGAAQTGETGAVLPQPIAVRLALADGSPVAGRIVTFEVMRSDGRLSADGAGPGGLTLQVRTDGAGEARAFWRLGSDAGSGNNRVEARSEGSPAVTFFASAEPGPARQINIGGGNRQRAEAGGPLGAPLVAWVSDGHNGVPGVPVTFRAVRGGGRIGTGAEATVTTDLTGHAGVLYTLGTDGGNEVVEATFPGNPGPPAEFTAFGVVRDVSLPTRLSGVVLDNAGRPIQGARCTLLVQGAALPPAATDAGGRFSFSGAPAGPVHLHVDGLVATHAAGEPVPPGSFPELAYEIVLVPHAANALAGPVLLPQLDPRNAVVFDNSRDVELTVAGIEGLKMTVAAGSMTRADGSVPGPGDPAVLALNQVHSDDVPMPMPDGAAPPFAWTLQPGGAHFDPPIRITFPNMTGLPAGATVSFLNFNHDTNRFEVVASGRVAGDGSAVVSDPGTGLSVAAWGSVRTPPTVRAKVKGCSCKAVIDNVQVRAGGSGTLDVLITNTSEGTCKVTWTLAKVNGPPTVEADPASGSFTLAPNTSSKAAVKLSVPAKTDATDTATLELSVKGDATATARATLCVLPMGETSTFVRFVGGDNVDYAAFRGTLTPLTADFSTQFVTEDPVGSGTNTTDTCWFKGSAIPEYTNANSISGGTWEVQPGNTYEEDRIGFRSNNLDAYYSAQGRTPCAFHTEQHMKLVCPGIDVEYKVNKFDIDVQAKGTTISRDGVAAPVH